LFSFCHRFGDDFLQALLICSLSLRFAPKAARRRDARFRFGFALAIASDAPEKEIAPNLSMSSNTLHSHIKNIYQRLRVRSRLGAVVVLHRARRQAIVQELLALHAHHPEFRHVLGRQAAGDDASRSSAAESSPGLRRACGT